PGEGERGERVDPEDLGEPEAGEAVVVGRPSLGDHVVHRRGRGGAVDADSHVPLPIGRARTLLADHRSEGGATHARTRSGPAPVGTGPDRRATRWLGLAQTKAEANTRETIVMTLSRMFMAGPEVSLNGSPTVSPTTAALWGSEPLPPWAPASMYFLALSQAPPALAMKMARQKPTTSEPARKPPRASTSMKPMTSGITMARPPGTSISLSAAPVEMSTHLVYSGSTPSLP